MMTAMTPWYIAINGLLLLALSVNVVRFRVKHRVNLGDGGQPELRQAMRVQGNFAEYVPMALLMIAAFE